MPDNFKVEKSAFESAQNSLKWCAQKLQVMCAEFSLCLRRILTTLVITEQLLNINDCCFVWLCYILKTWFFMFFVYPPPPVGGDRHNVFQSYGRLATTCCQLILIMRDAMCLYLVEGFPWNFALIFTLWVGIAEKVSRSEVKVIVKSRKFCTCPNLSLPAEWF